MLTMIIQRHLLAGPALIVAPHADDELLGCGAWLIRTNDLPITRTVIFCTTRQRRRREESIIALAGLHVDAVDLSLPELGPETWAAFPERVGQLRALFRELAPRYVFVPNLADPHPDHYQTHRLLATALSQESAILSTMFVLQYEGFSPLGTANWYLNATEVIAEKMQRLRSYRSQEQHYGLSNIAQHLNRYRGATLFRRAIMYAEAYHCLNADSYVDSVLVPLPS